MEKSFEVLCRSLGARILDDSELRAFFDSTPWADMNADYLRVGVIGRLSVWEPSSEGQRPYLLLGLPDDSFCQFFLDD